MLGVDGYWVMGVGCWELGVDGEVSGGVSGEVIKKHLTIRKADKQWDSALYGEVFSFFRRNNPRWMSYCPER